MKNALLLFLVFWFSHTQIFASINVNPLAFGAFRDRVYLQGENGPVEIDGASEINFDLQLVGKPGVTTATLTLGNVSYDLTKLEAPAGFRTNYGYSTYDNEIFDVESSSDSDWGSYINGKTFDFDLTIEGSSYSYSHNLPSVSSLPAAPNISLANILEWEKDSEGYDSAKIQEQDLYEFSWDSFSSAGNNDYIVVHLQELDGDDEIEVISETVLASDSTSFSVNGSNIQIGKTYVFYVEWVKVTEQSNPSGFSYAAGTDTSLPLLQTTAESITALQFALVASSVAISDPSGLPVVVQVGEDYQWNDTLDGVMLWGVWQDDDTNEWVIATVNYIGGRQKGAKGSYSSLPNELDVDHPYIVDGDTIDVTETNGHQYYQVTSVENGIIYAVDGDGAPLTDPSWWFVTKSAAEEFYNSKLHYAPSSLLGKTIYIPEEGFVANYSFTEDEAYYAIPLSLDQVEGIPYSYVANTSTTATLTLARETGDVIHQISFSSPTTADSNWTDLESNETGSATLQILTEDYWPSTLAGWFYQGTSMNDTFYFVDEGHVVFYDASDSNFSNRELSNITYTWEQIGPRIGKLNTSLGEETLLFFESNTSGFFDWEEIGSDDGSSGQFDLFYYPSGKAFESLVGSSISIGGTTYVFTSTNAVTVHSPSGTSSQEYAYLRENEDEVLLSVGSSLYKLDFYNHQYGRIIEGGSGYFSIHQNWATKGWVYYDELPWIYSNNQGEWMYQVLSNNNATNETELMYYEPWANVWAQNFDLKFTDKVFSADSWEDYDDFSGPELNSSKWDVAWWDGGMAPSIDQGNNRIVFTKGSSYEAKLSDQMNAVNSSAEDEYGRGYNSLNGNAPVSISDLEAIMHEIVTSPSNDDYGSDTIYFSDTHRSRWDSDDNVEVSEAYTYEKTGPNTAVLTIQESEGAFVANLNFVSSYSAEGTWSETEDGVNYSGTLTLDFIYSPHSLLEFSESDEIDGIEFEIMIPSDAPDKTCIGLFAVDYQSMFSAASEEDEENALKFDLDLCYFNGSLSLEYNLKNQATGVEEGNNSDVSLGGFHKAAFFFEDNKILFYLNNTLAGVHNYVRGAEKFVIRAQNEQNLDYSAYLRNVRVLRKKSYPQGWMWTNYYPWAYSHETGGWLYFELAKDSDGKPVMNYYDHNSGSWDLYGPSLNQYYDR